ncbi:Wzz/FepE/Etk N-terminal domain-containing protein [Janthinobacterium sp. PAMC25594]|uniref:GumC family protein n=1 Tax=Janthinobacterium sp. PAMC25594 TaxID=2861284 RepID=UPI001C63A664|nr:Wzz/FepE/Etk N-terminal domain-containing protein [Janthinobacterium sp. PAMC25594]QYG05596.1 lipopolysaccharide biosynthesis protein [Janthinobacterium sp. PAMC25594]
MSEQLKNRERSTLVNESNDEIHLLDILTALARQKKILFMVPLATGALAIAAAFLIKPTFSSTAVILPPQQQSSGVSAMLGQLGGLAGAAGGIAGLKNPNDLYVAMLQSRTIADKLISRFDLKTRFEVETLDEARKKLDGIATAASDKAGTISVLVEDKDPKFAAELANAFVSELSNLTTGLAITDAGQRRLFFEKQLIAVKDDLANAEIALRKTQESTGMLQLDGQVQGIIRNVAQLEGTIAAKEVQLNAMRSFATNNNPDLLRLQGEIQGYQAQLEKLKTGKLSKDGDLMVPTGKIPEVGIEYIRSLRNVKYQETIFELLSKQYELAKIDEAKESSSIQILDNAVPAEKKSKPKKMIIILLGFIGGGFLALFLALTRDAYLRSTKDEDGNYRWNVLKNAWRGKKTD